MAGKSKQLKANKDVELWERKLQIVERATRIQAEDFEALHEENKQKIHNRKREIQHLQGKIKLIKTLEEQKILQPDCTDIKVGRINAANIESAIEYQKQKCFDQMKEIDLLRHQHIVKKKELAQKKSQCKQLKKICHSLQKTGNHVTRTTKKTADLETKLADTKMRQKEDLYVSKKYEEIISILHEDAQHYEEQLDEMTKEMKEQGINLKCCQQAKEFAILTKNIQEEKLNLTQKKLKEATSREQRKLLKHKKNLSKIQKKENKHQEEVRKKAASIYNQTETGLDEEKAEQLKFYIQSFQQISEAIGISSLTELEDRIKTQRTTHFELTRLCQDTELELKKLKEREKEIKTKFEKQAATQKIPVDRNLSLKLVEMEETLKERERENNLKEAELNTFSMILGEARMSLERIMVLLYNALGQNILDNIDELSVQKIMKMCENQVQTLLQSFDKSNFNGIKKQFHPIPIQSKQKPAVNPEVKKKQEASVIETSSEDDENNRVLIKQRSQKFVEAHTRHKSNRRQILRL